MTVQGDESAERFCRRRNRLVAIERDKAALDVKRDWALCLARWMEHLHRHPNCPASLLMAVQDDMWLLTLRALHACDGSDDSLRAGRTGTRAGRGRPVRWGQLWVQAVQVDLGWNNASRDREATRARAMIVQTVLEHGSWHGAVV